MGPEYKRKYWEKEDKNIISEGTLSTFKCKIYWVENWKRKNCSFVNPLGHY